jgi:hypothetical protein
MPVETGRIKHGLAHDVSDCRNFGYPFALLVAFGSPYPSRPNGSASEIRLTAFIPALAHFVSLDAHKQPDVPQKA